METSLGEKRKKIARFKEERPIYREILNFYAVVIEEQESIRPKLQIKSLDPDEEPMKSRRERRVSLLKQKEFEIDLGAAKEIFYGLCRISQGITQKMALEVPKIEHVLEHDQLKLEKILIRHYDDKYLAKETERWNLDKGILSFLVKASVRPSLEAQMEQLKKTVDLETWLRRNCPICGSLPHIAELRDEGGKKYLQCSFCGCQWRWERLACPYCQNRTIDTLHYFYSEEEEAYRVDLCDQCKKYIKTVDSRKLDYEPDLDLEDVITIHLDLLALERGYKRPVPTPWGPPTGI
jgi:FdhE protein